MYRYKNVHVSFGSLQMNKENGSRVNINNNRVENVLDPIDEYDACNKNYLYTKLFQIGDLKWSIKNTDNNGWLICDGRSLSRTEYSDLFNIIGTSFGSLSGTTFNLPNCKGRVMGAAGNGAGLTPRNVGDAIGSETHTLTVNQLPSHTHTGTTSSSGSHTHTITDPGHTHTQNTINDDFNNSGGDPPGFTGDSAGNLTWSNINSNTTGISINESGSHTHTFTTDSTGNNSSFNIIQPTLFVGNVFVFSGKF